MDPSIFSALYVLMTGGYAIACVVAFTGRHQIARWACMAGAAINFPVFILIIVSTRRLPIFGDFESITTITLVIGFLHLIQFYAGSPSYKRFYPFHAKCIFVSILVLLIYLAFFPKTLNQDFYMYDDIRVIVFFHFRILASSLFIYTAILFIAALAHGYPDGIHMGRNFLLMGSAIFLISEFSGSLWCLNWFGDSWHWSKGFLKASSLFLTAMLACHIPSNWKNSHRIQTIFGSLPAAGSLWILFLH